jgi:predicted GNAT superfamily acetyltransferase
MPAPSTVTQEKAMASAVRIRNLSTSDYGAIIGVIDEWWGGRPMAGMLPRVFFEHFADTSFAAERNGTLAGFLVGFCSQSRRGEAYIHFVGVHPGERGRGLGRRLYETFFGAAAARGCLTVRAITAPVNSGSVAFHRRMGFEIEPGETEHNGIPVTADYDGPGQDRFLFVRHLRPVPDSDRPLFGIRGGEM